MADTALATLGSDRVLALCNRLVADQRDVVLLRIVGDLSVDQVAEALGKSPGAVKQLQRRAFENIREEISSEGRHGRCSRRQRGDSRGAARSDPARVPQVFDPISPFDIRDPKFEDASSGAVDVPVEDIVPAPTSTESEEAVTDESRPQATVTTAAPAPSIDRGTSADIDDVAARTQHHRGARSASPRHGDAVADLPTEKRVVHPRASCGDRHVDTRAWSGDVERTCDEEPALF